MNSTSSTSIILISLVAFMSSCVIPESNHQESTFHLLTSLDGESNSTLLSAGTSFYLRQVELPSYLQDNRLVARPKQGLIEFAETERWGESLEEGISRVVGLNLSERLDTLGYSVFPHRRKPGCRFDLGLTFSRFERIAPGEVLIEVLCDLYRDNKLVSQVRFQKELGFEEPRQTHDASLQVLALSQCLSDLSAFLVLEMEANGEKGSP